MHVGIRRESVGCRAQGDDRIACLEVAVDGLHLIVRQDSPARLDEHQVGVVKIGQARNVRVRMRIDDAGVRIHGEEHGAAEAVQSRQHPGQHGQPFLRAILLVAGHQHDVAAIADPASGAWFVTNVLLGTWFGHRFGCAASKHRDQGEADGYGRAEQHGVY